MNDKIVVTTRQYKWDNEKEVVISKLKEVDPVGMLAVNLAAQLAIACCEMDGEDSTGRQKFRLQTPIEVATRACDIAQAMWNEFESRGFIVPLPHPDTLKVETPEKPKQLGDQAA